MDGADYDVLQDGRTVIVVDPTGHRMRTLDPAAVSLSSPIDLPATALVAMGGGTLAVADTSSGSVWLEKADDLDDVAVADTAPAFTTAPGVAIAAGGDGSVAIAAPKGSTLTVIGPDGTPKQQRLAAPDLPAATVDDPDPVAVTMVGLTAVVLDRPGNRILVGDKSFPLPDGSNEPVLQQSGAASGAVSVATDTALLRISTGLRDHPYPSRPGCRGPRPRRSGWAAARTVRGAGTIRRTSDGATRYRPSANSRRPVGRPAWYSGSTAIRWCSTTW